MSLIIAGNKIIDFTTKQLETTRDYVESRPETAAACIAGRAYTARNGLILALETAIDAITLPFVATLAPFVRAPAVICSGKEGWKNYIEKTEMFSAKNVLRLAARVVACAFAAFASFVGAIFSDKFAVSAQEFFQLLKKKEVVKEQVKEIAALPDTAAQITPVAPIATTPASGTPTTTETILPTNALPNATPPVVPTPAITNQPDTQQGTNVTSTGTSNDPASEVGKLVEVPQSPVANKESTVATTTTPQDEQIPPPPVQHADLTVVPTASQENKETLPQVEPKTESDTPAVATTEKVA